MENVCMICVCIMRSTYHATLIFDALKKKNSITHSKSIVSRIISQRIHDDEWAIIRRRSIN